LNLKEKNSFWLFRKNKFLTSRNFCLENEKTKLLRQASLTTTGYGIICSDKVYFAEFHGSLPIYRRIKTAQ